MKDAGLPDDTLAAYLGKLAERTAAPAGGVTAALNAAQAAALLAMTARYCDGPTHAGDAETRRKIIDQADQLRHACVALMAADGESYGCVMAAYQLQKDTEAQRGARAAAIATALVTAAAPPAEVITSAARLLELAQTLQPIVSRSIAPDGHRDVPHQHRGQPLRHHRPRRPWPADQGNHRGRGPGGEGGAGHRTRARPLRVIGPVERVQYFPPRPTARPLGGISPIR